MIIVICFFTEFKINILFLHLNMCNDKSSPLYRACTLYVSNLFVEVTNGGYTTKSTP